MFMLDRWDALRADEEMDSDTVSAAQALADEMCQAIIDRMGLTVVRDEKSLVVVGRGLRYVFPLRGDNIPLKYDDHNRSEYRKSASK
jgi:hypothetical protein